MLTAVLTVVLAIAAALLGWAMNAASMRSRKMLSEFRSVLLVIAHPDDEAMFFVPTVRACVEEGVIVHILCMTTGNYDKIGHIRREELLKSAAALGVSPRNVRVIDDPELQDGMNATWNLQKAQEYIVSFAQQQSVEAVVTFDDYGVSGHPNHISVYHAVSSSASELPLPIFQLKSTPIWRKYLGPIDAIGAYLQAQQPRGFAVTCWNPFHSHRAMVAHWSQYVWYRRLFVIFSRYTTLNNLERIN